MNLRVMYLILSLSTLLFADQVVLKNGYIITGAIIKKDGDKLTLKSEVLGEVTMPWAAVKSVRSDESLTVVLRGESVNGKISSSGDNLQVATGAATRTAPLADVSALRNPAEQHNWERLQHPGWLELWTGNFDLGLALARGNARTDTLTNAFNATRATRQDKVILYFNQIYGTARINNVNNTIASAVRGGWSYHRDVTPRLFVGTLNDWEHDRFQSLDLRFVVGGGMGWNAATTDRAALSFQAGADYERENFIDNLSRNSAELNFGDDLQYKLSGATTLTQAFRLFANLTDAGAYRMNFDLSGVTTLKKWLGWHLTASDRFLSNPVLGRQRNDLLLSTGFRVSFAR